MSKYLEYFAGAFDASVAEKMKPENKPYVAYSEIDGVAYTVISKVPKEEGTMYTIYKVVSKDISNCTYNMVDLGLPSGLKWADRNVGATSPEHYGSYFQWGDTNPYTFDGVCEVTATELVPLLQQLIGDEMEVTEDNIGEVLEMMEFDGGTNLTTLELVLIIDKVFNWDSYFDTTDGGSTFKKYNNNGGLTVLESIDDAATVHMGSQYRTPTMDEMQELINNTTQTFIDLDGNEYSKEEVQKGVIEYGKLKGVRLAGLNGNSIFMPATGYCNDLLNGAGARCLLASSILNYYNDPIAYNLVIDIDGSISEASYSRANGYPVRGVQA